jgi:phosphoenolpyruvate carboxykinase (GTP)
MAAIGSGTGALFTNTAYNPSLNAVWWDGKTQEQPSPAGWYDWRGRALAGERAGALKDQWSHPNSRFTTTLANVPNLSPRWQEPKGVPLDAIIFGGRVRRREPLIRALPDLAAGVYDGLTLGAEATAAAEGKAGVLRYDPMSMRPFLSYCEGDYAAHWLEVVGRARERPIFAHVNWFQKDDAGDYIWPGYGENLRALLWLLDLKAGRAKGRQTPVGVVPAASELNLEGLDLPSERVDALLHYNPDEWRPEVESRREHLAQFERLPPEVMAAHEALAKEVGV